MPVLPRPSSPRAAWADLRAFLRRRSREQTIGAICALVATALIVVAFYFDPKVNTAPPPTVIYVESFRADRTDAQIIADQKKNQAKKEAAEAERQRQFKELGNQLGIK
ncbi:hypothetical protein M8312_10255 [Sphingomonas sp. KRR8]|uniref:hypothetical protein n=1 Tax=Sphingomonas sp. KRR8 TaxID=2942996 RepID=UPI00202154C9|nr:hypothetical protein [Sphingomonas sp. KRR8]URD60168.1 hypothetical protein M8312_10255 [Sphingomonas sp. KRR8]